LITMDGFVNCVSKIFNSIILDDQFDIEDYQIVFDFIKKEIFIRNRNFDELYYTNFNFLLNELDVLNEEMNKLNIIDKDAYIEYVVRTRNTLFQKFFRESLLSKFDNKCAICGINKPELLVASHIVPFSKCETNKQMIDVDNGLLLCSMHDKLFDTGYITFDKDGIIIFSPEIDNPILCEELKLNTNIKLRIEHLNERRKHNLDFHNKVIFKK
ncbi:MAG: HNH endonuclease, partial [Peptostreptococcaceae bacterium]